MISTISKEVYDNNVKPSKEQVKARILELVSRFASGISTIEIAQIMGVPLHYISGRFTELKHDNIIVDKGKKYINDKPYTVYIKYSPPVTEKNGQMNLF